MRYGAARGRGGAGQRSNREGIIRTPTAIFRQKHHGHLMTSSHRRIESLPNPTDVPSLLVDLVYERQMLMAELGRLAPFIEAIKAELCLATTYYGPASVDDFLAGHERRRQVWADAGDSFERVADLRARINVIATRVTRLRRSLT